MRTSGLYDQLCDLLGQSSDWADRRHLQTLVWMVIGVICSECISLTKWGIYVRSRAQFAQSHQRRFSRWLHNSRINVQRLYSPLIAAAIAKWRVSEITLIEDTTLVVGRVLSDSLIHSISRTSHSLSLASAASRQ